jgi:hypothetical protein
MEDADVSAALETGKLDRIGGGMGSGDSSG